MGRRRRRIVKIIKKKLPTVFTCPKCGEESVRASPPHDGTATVKCGACGLSDTFPVEPKFQLVDIYCRFTDRFYGTISPTPTVVSVDTPREPARMIEDSEQKVESDLPENVTVADSEEEMVSTQAKTPSEIFFEAETPVEDRSRESETSKAPEIGEETKPSETVSEEESASGLEAESSAEKFPVESVAEYPLVEQPPVEKKSLMRKETQESSQGSQES